MSASTSSLPPVGVLLSGGLDSAALVALLAHQNNRKLCPVYVRFGLPWEPDEIRFAKRFLHEANLQRVTPLQILDQPLDGAYRQNWSQTGPIPDESSPDEAVFLPGRNVLLATRAILHLSSIGVRRLAFGTLRTNPFPDGQPRYFRRLGAVLSDSIGVAVTIEHPFSRLDKADLIRRARAYPIHLSLSCLAPNAGIHCGRCNKCEERRRAFSTAGVPDQTAYHAPAHANGEPVAVPALTTPSVTK